MKKKILSLIVCAGVLTTSLASCSPSEGPTESGSDFVTAELTTTEKSLGMLIGEMLTLTASPEAAEVLVDNSGMSGLFSANHLHAAFDSSNALQNAMLSENMYLSQSADPITLDIGHIEAAGQLFLWNYNDPSALDSGMKEVEIAYSTDNANWTVLGTYTLAQCVQEENDSYGGNIATNQDGERLPIDFGGVSARYIRITPKSNWGGSGYGLSEVRLFRAKNRPENGDAIYPEAFTPNLESNAENAVNNTGMSALTGKISDNETHSNNPADMWLTDSSASDAMLILNLDGTYPVSQIKLWNYNDPNNLGAGIQEFEVYYTTTTACSITHRADGTDFLDFSKGSWERLGTYTLPQASGDAALTASLTIDMEGKHAQHIKIVPKSNYGGSGFGLSEVRVYSSSGWAVEPARAWSGLFSSSGSFAYQGNTSSTPFSTSNNGRGWLGGDGIHSTSLSGAQLSGSATESSKTLFTFQDSFEGNFSNYRSFGMTHGYGDSAGFSIGMRNMAYMLLEGNLPDPRNAQFYLELENGKSNNHPLGNIYPGSYWLGDSTVIDGAVYTLANKFSGLAIEGVDFYKHTLAEDGFPDMTQEPELLGEQVWTQNDEYHFEAILEQDDYIYVYGRKNNRLVVSRTTPEGYKTLSGFTFWDGENWVDDPEAAEPISRYTPGNEYNVVYMAEGPFAGKYLNIFTDGSIGGTVSYGVSDSITGPFLKGVGMEGNLYWATERYEVGRDSYADSDVIYEQWNYNAKGQPAISKRGELLITYHFGLHDDRVPAWNFVASSVAKEYEHPTFINLIMIAE